MCAKFASENSINTTEVKQKLTAFERSIETDKTFWIQGEI